jgi:ketosteroid isomerase-like protein
MKKISITLVPIITLLTLITSCKPHDVRYESQEDVQSLLDAEKKASDLSQKEGFTKAMLASASDSAVLLRPEQTPIKGAAIKAYLMNEPDSAYTITWAADKAVVAASGELGYTYGTYTMRIKKDGSIRRGTYATIWQREQKNGWKMLLDTGNPGLAPRSDTSAPATAQPQ